MASILKNISEQAKAMLSEEFPSEKIEVNLVQSHYFPQKRQTIFCIVADVNNRIYAGSGESIGKAIDKMVEEIRQDSSTDVEPLTLKSYAIRYFETLPGNS